MPGPNNNVVVLGLGNLLLADEGVGVQVAQRLLSAGEPLNATVIDAGTDVLGIIDLIGEAEKLIVVDAMNGGAKPGSIYLTKLSECERKEAIASLHGFDISMALTLSGKNELQSVTVIGVEPEVIDWSMELSVTVEKSIPKIIKIIRDEVPE